MRCARVLIVVDDITTVDGRRDVLASAQHEVGVCLGVGPISREVEMFRPDLVVTDLSFGDADQLTTMVRRIHSSYRPLLLCALDDATRQAVPALEAGADGWIVRPFTAHDLEVHVRTLLRRVPWATRAIHIIGRLVVDEDAHVAIFDGDSLALSAKEFRLLAMLAENAGAVLSKRVLLDSIWGYDAHDENLVEVHLSALRRRLPREARDLIHTVRGVGYTLHDDHGSTAPEVSVA
jgi:two-component system, OmpR family, response regulator